MPSYVKEAHVYVNNNGISCIEMKYTRYIEGRGYVNFPECYEAEPIGNWEDIDASHESFRYEEFLDTMVEKTIAIRRTMAVIELDNVLCENHNIHSILRIMNAVKIIDPTFVPVIINTRCTWQKQVAKDFCAYTFPDVIYACKNTKRLDKLFTVLRMIEEEL
jgi:hypothetical protein|tara:strand:- start:32 stop:517 length:486 start_codon:yes stop_codon:yes gene_type:complete